MAEGEQHHQLRITRARYECDVARRRFMLVDPANRLVAAGLEAEWNAYLSALATAKDELGRFRAENARSTYRGHASPTERCTARRSGRRARADRADPVEETALGDRAVKPYSALESPVSRQGRAAKRA
jgi:hypothetical protein